MKPIIDAHLDLAWNALHWNRDLTKPLEEVRQYESSMQDHAARGRATVTIPELRKAGVRVCLGTVLVRSKPEVVPAEGFSRRDLDFQNQTIAHCVGRGQAVYYHTLEELGEIQLIRTSADLKQHSQVWLDDSIPPLGVIMAMEGADPIRTPQQAQLWWDLGLRCVSLSHYRQGPYAPGTGSSGPLTDAGRELLREFTRLGMIVDLTHCSEPAFFEVLERFAGPVIASHNMCRDLTPGDRQFSNEQIDALVARGAVIGMAFDAWMLKPGWQIGTSDPTDVPIEVAANHIDHICQRAGNCQHVGIGSDLDGGFGTEQTPRELQSIADLQLLVEILSRRGYSDTDIDAIFYGNYLRFFLEHLPAE
ncbi:peptidase [Bremerella cremea]|uniref:Peptidase n=1 Tax=Blastopirellula marina TaxID=124 RepID=A0A2S8FC05_9BACT|nr:MULTISPECIES: membrane dipeptidase [Pirellulaceae]PQO29696.1 peptidase [Blastopirellula marina]RCS42998.1 peptidase [Bremerella cremea]